jgi:phosphopantetheinyl transferase (holo-ACP synthase)
VFHEAELEHGDAKEDVAALIWSAKEAVVKALGCGFHLVDPLEVMVELRCGDHQSLLLKARLAERAREKLGVKAENPITLKSLRHSETWVSVALLG